MLPSVEVFRIFPYQLFGPTKFFAWVVFDISQNIPSIAPNVVVMRIQSQSVRSKTQSSFWKFFSFDDCTKIIENLRVWKGFFVVRWESRELNSSNSHSSEYRMLTIGTESSWGISFTSLHSLLCLYIQLNLISDCDWILLRVNLQVVFKNL